MGKKGQTQTADTVMELPVEVQEELSNLRGFRDLIGERWGYWFGRKMKQQEMSEACKEERKAVSEIRKSIKIEEFIQNSDLDGYNAKMKEIKEAREVVTKKAKPFLEKISPLSKAVRFLDSVAIPDALKQLGTPVQPRFSLSEFISQQLAQQKKK